MVGFIHIYEVNICIDAMSFLPVNREKRSDGADSLV